MESSTSEERKRDEPATKEMVHKTKVIQFLGRTTPIILQNDNGPCPLLAICNVLLLKNSLNLSPDIPEVSQEKLLSLVAERLIDSNSNANNKDAGYMENQQQNIADAIDLLPRLTTGIDVNIKFRRIDDFEFTPECAIFDLLDIPLYHGWIVDPQDHDTADAIGSKSYNTLMGELVALETRNMESKYKSSEDDSVDFVAATTAALGVPSPCLSRGRSFDESLVSVPDHQKSRKGDIEEEAELLRVLKLSQTEMPVSSADNVHNDWKKLSVDLADNIDLKKPEAILLVEGLEGNIIEGDQKSCEHEESIPSDRRATGNCSTGPKNSEPVSETNVCSSTKIEQENDGNILFFEDYGNSVTCGDVNAVVEDKSLQSALSSQGCTSKEDGHIQRQSILAADPRLKEDNPGCCNMIDSPSSLVPAADSDSSGRRPDIDESEVFTSSIDGSEPIYEGEECIMEARSATFQDGEPIYEGEVVLAEQVDKRNGDANYPCEDGMTPKEGELIRNFLKNSASQLTVYGLFFLQDGLKERELCVFFRNNHFNTMFKFEGELYILATDQGYINQPDLVWEKLNEVNGDTVYMTGNFKEFKVEDHENTTWDEQNAMATTADYLASMDNSAQAHAFNSDLQLAIALQQQEFEQQPPQRNNNLKQPTTSGSSRLVTGQQVSRNGRYPPSAPKQEAKSAKDKCIVM